MEVVVALFGLILVVYEIFKADKYKTPTAMMFMMLSNFIFLHGWLYIQWIFDSDLNIGADTVILIFISDVAFCLCVIVNSLLATKVNQEKLLIGADGYEFPVKVLFLLAVGISVFYLWEVGVSVFAGDVEYSRHTNKKGHGYLLIFLIYAVPMCATYFYLNARKEKNWYLVFIAFAIALTLQFLTGFRAYLVTVLMALYFVYCDNAKKFSASSFAMLLTILCVMFVAISYYRLGTDIRAEAYDVDALIDRVSSRVFTELPLQIDRLILISDVNGFAHGATYMWDLQSAMPGPGQSLGDRMLGWIDPENELNGMAPLTPSIIGESYLNFGGMGVFWGSAVTGLCCVMVDKITYRSKLGLVTKGYMAVFMVDAIIVGIGGSLASRIGPFFFFVAILAGMRFFTYEK